MYETKLFSIANFLCYTQKIMDSNHQHQEDLSFNVDPREAEKFLEKQMRNVLGDKYEKVFFNTNVELFLWKIKSYKGQIELCLPSTRTLSICLFFWI